MQTKIAVFWLPMWNPDAVIASSISSSFDIPLDNIIGSLNFENLSINQPRIREISLFEVFDNDLAFLKNSIYPIYLLEDDLINVKKCGFISDKSFYINIQNFTESKKYNS